MSACKCYRKSKDDKDGLSLSCRFAFFSFGLQIILYQLPSVFKNSLGVVSFKWQHIKYHALKNEGMVQEVISTVVHMDF
jgi:hypothetical protein